MKICTKCGEQKSLESFYRDKYYKDGRKSVCKDCERSRYSLICSHCGKQFHSSSKSTKYCSIECRGGSIVCNCTNCCKSYTTTRYKLENCSNNFCSKECYWAYNQGINNTSYKREEVSCDLCGNIVALQPKRLKSSKYHYCSKECKDKHHSLLILGKGNPNYKGKVQCDCAECGTSIELIPSLQNISKLHFCSKECQYSYAKTRYLGENNPNYNPELSNKDREVTRHIDGYKKWVLDVYTRDQFTCTRCYDKTSGNLVAHHLNGYNWDVDNRLNVDNGITLCTQCHKDFHLTYGYGNNTKEQFNEFTSNKLIRVEG